MRAIDMVNSSNQKMVAKSGIEIDAELNIENLDLAQRIIDKKMNPPDLPARVRNIFVFDSYIATDGSRTTTGTVAAAPKPATATNTHE